MNKTEWTKINKWSKKIRAINHLGGKCKICGNNNIFHLCFHHICEIEKDFQIGEKINLKWSKLLKEIEKCDLLCENCHQELHYLERGKTIKDDSRRKDKVIYLEYSGSKCERCGYNKCESSLSFHHKEPMNKSFDIGSLSKRLDNINELDTYITEELDKCDVICRNCHIENHCDIDFFNKFKEQIYHKVNNFKEISQKLNREEVYKKFDSGMKQIEISKFFNVDRSTICCIIKNRNK